VNDNYRDLKDRLRRLDEQLVGGRTGDIPFAQAVSALRRQVRRGDRSRDPSPELQALLVRAEALSRKA
jgi:hypothetical protein